MVNDGRRFGTVGGHHGLARRHSPGSGEQHHGLGPPGGSESGRRGWAGHINLFDLQVRGNDGDRLGDGVVASVTT